MYKEALERAKKMMDSKRSVIVNKQALETIFPELAESEDERALRIIRKRTCYDPVPISDEDRRIVENWLEKQKERPTGAKLERVIEASRRVLNNWLDGSDCPDVSGDFAELEYAIREYDGEEKQKECVAEEMQKFNEDPMSVEINSVVDKILAKIGEQAMAAAETEAQKVAEQNSANVAVEDIFGVVESEENAEDNSIF